MELLGSKKETTAQTFEHYEETLLHNTLQVLLLLVYLTVELLLIQRHSTAGNTAVRDGDLVLGNSGATYYVRAVGSISARDTLNLRL